MSNQNSVFQLMQGIECSQCLDTFLDYTLFGVMRCSTCIGKHRLWSNPAVQLQRRMDEFRTHKREPEKLLFSLARALTHFTIEAPLTLRDICANWQLNERAAKQAVADLRGEWELPIGSLRQPPYGAFWISTVEEFLQWSKPYRSQAITSLAVLHKLQRRHFPKLFGQKDFEFADDIARSIKEAL